MIVVALLDMVVAPEIILTVFARILDLLEMIATIETLAVALVGMTAALVYAAGDGERFVAVSTMAARRGFSGVGEIGAAAANVARPAFQAVEVG